MDNIKKFAIGTENQIKIDAFLEIVSSHYNSFNYQAFNVESEVSNQPLSMEEIIQGAKNRAKNAFIASGVCHYGVGIESGIFEAKGTETNFLETCICAIFDGNRYHIGMSCGYEIPPAILSLVLEKKLDLGQACFASGITANQKLGAAEGLVGLLSENRINRKEYTKQCLTMAFAQLKHINWYPMLTTININ